MQDNVSETNDFANSVAQQHEGRRRLSAAFVQAFQWGAWLRLRRCGNMKIANRKWPGWDTGPLRSGDQIS